MKAKVFSFCLAMVFAFSMESQAQYIISESWNLTGNSLSSNSSFLGTTNYYPLVFKTNNVTRMTLAAGSPNLGIGVSPASNLHIHSNTNVNNFLMTNLNVGNTIYHGFRIKQDHQKVYILQQENAYMYIQTPGGGLAISDSGKVGFGTNTPYHTIHVVDGNILISKNPHRADGSTNGSLLFGATVNTINCTHGAWGIEYVNNDDDGYGLNFWKPSSPCNQTKGNDFLFLADNGNIGIGTHTPQAKLAVNGEVLAKSVRVNATASYWPDYVFEKDYNLMSIRELGAYVQTHKHLPGIPSAKEVEKKQDVDLGEMNTLLLQKMEEMTLYIIQLEKRVSELENK